MTPIGNAFDLATCAMISVAIERNALGEDRVGSPWVLEV